MSTSVQYASFLIRLWREDSPGDTSPEWRGEVEHIQSGQRCTFSTLDEMLGFLRQLAEDSTSLRSSLDAS